MSQRLYRQPAALAAAARVKRRGPAFAGYPVASAGNVRAHSVRWQRRRVKNTYPVQGTSMMYRGYRLSRSGNHRPRQMIIISIYIGIQNSAYRWEELYIKSGLKSGFYNAVITPLIYLSCGRFSYSLNSQSFVRRGQSDLLGRHGNY